MAEDRHRQEYPQQHRPEDIKHQPPPSYYHHLPSRDAPHTDTESSPHSRTTMATSVTLPSIHDPRPSGYGPPPPAGRGYVSDPRYASPNTVNGYPPPPGSQQQPAAYLPPLQPQADPRSAYPPPEPRGAYYDDRRPPPHPAYHEQYASEYYYRGLPQGHHNGYPHDYPRPPPGYGQEYGQPGIERPREAPRQRTSIACRYCRKRKVCYAAWINPLCVCCRQSTYVYFSGLMFSCPSFLDTLQWPPERSRWKVPKLRSHESGVHLSTCLVF